MVQAHWPLGVRADVDQIPHQPKRIRLCVGYNKSYNVTHNNTVWLRELATWKRVSQRLYLWDCMCATLLPSLSLLLCRVTTLSLSLCVCVCVCFSLYLSIYLSLSTCLTVPVEQIRRYFLTWACSRRTPPGTLTCPTCELSSRQASRATVRYDDPLLTLHLTIS